MKFIKWVGIGVGWALGGPIGAFVGFMVGSSLDTVIAAKDGVNARTQSGDFTLSLLILSAAVMKADGKVLKSELNFVKSFLTKNFGAKNIPKYMQALKGILEKEIPLKEVCEQIKQNMEHPLRLQLLHYLFGISIADGIVSSSEVDVIRKISNYLSISDKDYESILNMFYKNPKSAYKILEIDETASEEEIKKAYRRLAIKHHPDKVAQLGDSYKKAAKEKFQEIQDAYETIKKLKGIK